ncbi:helix-turn-helix domain-containing protein [Furfurilactobacillus rossiae]|uniref:HTH cro/C1-type domain-containing protein n=1 Tax=Furfurilactobacillus rossiae DSM 15814 TaxID=1114972 RepID=A0A0R1RHX5_9LACO|nr:Rgg/GadR/MutR family transcriptional regulator [Furfurilactobacillus rossiae]KRL53922.1 hypothetical protein FD35_GL000751 [Furfurilactobacillus rossiae DSM 15814]QFR66662.1 helix-turn-helix domain-containing protein [Furfurilactobacillus rossiae]QLE62137.1 Positive transcriptional regulator MutR [Furfurilactobacillus rossiae]
MQSLGQTFHELRKSKNLTLKEVADDEISMAVISKFENDQTMLGVDRFLHLLQQINVTTTDFFYRYRQSDERSKKAGIEISDDGTPLPEIFDVLNPFNDIFQISSDNSQSKAQKILRLQTYIKLMEQELKKDPSLTNRLKLSLAKASLKMHQSRMRDHISTHQEMIPIIDYLSNVSSWTAFELLFFISTSIYMDIEDSMMLFSRFMKQADAYVRLTDLRSLGYSVCFTLFSIMIAHRTFSNAKFVLEKFDDLLSKDTDVKAEFAIKSLFLHGWYLYATGQEDVGKDKCNTVLQLCKTLHLTDDSRSYQEIYKGMQDKKSAIMYSEIFY